MTFTTTNSDVLAAPLHQSLANLARWIMVPEAINVLRGDVQCLVVGFVFGVYDCCLAPLSARYLVLCDADYRRVDL